MILHQIELQGFLSHRGTPRSDGSYGFTTVDFSHSPLWLIHGENGAGKSALFDAICFALYKRARGAGAGGHSGQNLGHLVHHGADRAQVRVTIEIGGTVYRVDRAVNHIDKSTSGNSSQIWESQSDWETLRQMSEAQRTKDLKAVADTHNKAEKWIEQKLRMSFETFTYTALLRQGETDAFLVADANDRKSCLLQLLDLSSFEALGAAAAKDSSEARKLAVQAATRRDGTHAVAPAEVEEAAQTTGAAKTQWQNAQAFCEGAKQALENGEKAAQWQADIEILEQRNARDAPLIARKDTIVEAANRARELGRVMPQLRAVWGAKTRVAAEEKNWDDVKTNLKKASHNGAVLQVELAPARQAVTDSQTAMYGAKAVLEVARLAAQEAADETASLADIEKWETQIAEADGSLAPLNGILGRESEIKARSKRINELSVRVPLLENWSQARKAENSAVKTLGDAKDAHRKAALQLDAQQKIEESRAADLENANDHVQQEQDGIRELETEFAQLKKYSKDRKEVEDKGVCHFCGSTLEDEHIQQRLHEERAQWNRQGHALTKQIDAAKTKFQITEQNALTAQQQHTFAAGTLRKLASALARAEFAAQTAQESLDEKQGNSRRAAAKCVAFAAQIDDLDALQAELDELEQSDVSGEVEALNEAKNKAVAGQTTIRNARAELDKLPKWSETQREEKRGAQTKTATALMAANQTVADADTAARTAQEALADLEKQIETNETNLKNLGEQSADLQRRCAQISAECERLRAELPTSWQVHDAASDADALQQLKAENERLQRAETEEAELRVAQERAQDSIVQIHSLRARLDELPAEHTRPIAELQAALDEAGEGAAAAESALQDAEKSERELEIAAREFAAREAELREAEVELSLCKTLAEALGRNGLQRAIQEKAQQKLKAEADKTLLKLSGGEWSISLQETGEDKLEIWATDHRSEQDKRFEYLSGGEKFRIAVALAVAIGQSVTGNAPLGTLIIDEGFGALDATNRKRMVAELQRLSSDVFGGGRVVVVSHQDDVCDDFPQRYAIERDEDGVVSATRFPSA